MENLHIPLHSHHPQTTRRARRVVWHQALLMACLLLLTAYAGRLWLSRNTLERATPDQALAHLHFTPNKKGWELLEKHLDRVALVSGALLTVKDIRPFTKGEFSIFLLPDGKRVLAVRAKKENLPLPLFDSLGLEVQSVKNTIHILTTQPLTLRSQPAPKPWFFYLPHLSHPLGTLHTLGKTTKNGVITASTTSMTIKLKKEAVDSVLPNGLFSNKTIAAAVLTNEISSSLPEAVPKNVAIAQGILLEFWEETTLADVEKLFNRIVSMQNIILTYRPLPDSTLAQEIILEETPSNHEQVVLNGSRITRARTKGTDYLFLAEKTGKKAISSNQNMMEMWLADTQNKYNKLCKNPSLALSTRQLATHEADLSNSYTVFDLLMSFDAVCVSHGFFITNIRFLAE